MRAISSLVVVVGALAACSAIDNFGKFSVGASVDMAGGGCTPGCDCIAADPAVGVPDHCALTPSNGITCSGVQRSAANVTLAGGAYTLDSGASPPTLTDPSGNTVMSGSVAGSNAIFCLGSFIADGAAHLTIVGTRPVAIVADSLVRMTNGTWALAGGYATDANGAAGVAGGTSGGSSGNAGTGASGGHPGVGSPGSGGSGGGSASSGAVGGSAMGSPITASGAGSSTAVVGSGGGGGGKGSVEGGGGGGGAGALQISAGWAIELDSVTIDAAGGGGAGGLAAGATGAGTAGGGGGGGGGGILTLEAPTVSITGGCLSVVGGPGGAGGAITRGGDAHAATACPFTGSGGVAPLNGGPGGAPGSGMTSAGGNGTGITGGGGGGIGGYGRVTVRAHNPPPITTPPGVDPMAAYTPVTLP